MKNQSLLVGLADQCKPDLNSIGRNYPAAVRRGGHIPVILPFSLDRRACRTMLERIDILLLCGGGDIAACHFGEEQSPLASPPNDERDNFELLLVSVAIELHKPVVGVCRGLQLINVALGGTLWQDITGQSEIVHQRPDKLWEGVHNVVFDEGSRLQEVMGCSSLCVNSTHHQAIRTLGRSLRAVAWADDGTIEAIESDRWPLAAVQWHPERMLDEDRLWKGMKSWAWWQ